MRKIGKIQYEELSMRKLFCFIALITVLLLGSGAEILSAQRGTNQPGSSSGTIEVKLGSPLPKASPWGKTLDEIASEWNRITNGQVRVNVRHGGIEGSEEKMYQSLESNTIQAAVFTSFGLSYINPAVMTMSVPFLIRTEAEFTAVMKEVQGDLEARANSGKFFVVAWSKAGFVNIFSKSQVLVPDDLKKLKVGSNPEAGDMNTVFKSMGFQVVEAGLNDMGQKVATNSIQSVYMAPAGMAAYSLHKELPYMLSTNIAPVLGGIVINQVTWKAIGNLNPRYQQELLRATRQISEKFDRTMQADNNNTLNTMTRAGLKINRPTPAQEQLWYNEVDKVISSLLGSTFDRNLYRKITDILTKYRGGR
jgi:TRAP-type C4-dicarboxylate transport system substrate-binding protein